MRRNQDASIVKSMRDFPRHEPGPNDILVQCIHFVALSLVEFFLVFWGSLPRFCAPHSPQAAGTFGPRHLRPAVAAAGGKEVQALPDKAGKEPMAETSSSEALRRPEAAQAKEAKAAKI